MSPAAKGPRGCSTCVLHRQAGLGEGRAPDTCHSGVSSGRLGNPKCPNSHAEAVTKPGRKEAHSALPLPPLGRSATGRAMLLASFLSRGPGGLPCNGTRNGSSSLQAARNNGGGRPHARRCPCGAPRPRRRHPAAAPSITMLSRCASRPQTGPQGPDVSRHRGGEPGLSVL